MITFQYHVWHTVSPNNSMTLLSHVECIEMMENEAGRDTEDCVFHFPFQF